MNLESPTPILTSQFPPEPPKMTFPGTATSQTAAPCARRTASMGVPCSPMACAGVKLNLQTICLMWSPPTGFPQHVLSPPFSPNPRLNLALLVANVPVASPHSPNSLSVSPGRTHRRLLHLHRLSTRALRSMWTRFGAFRLSSPVGELHVLASAGCLGYAPADYLSPHPTISTHAAVYSVHGAQFASPFVLINPCPLPLATQTSSAMGAISHCRLWQWNHGKMGRTGSFERRCSRLPRQQLPPSPTSHIAGLPAGQVRARRSQLRATIVDTEWQV